MGLDFLAGHAGALAAKPAVICGDRVLDFATLSRQANRVANAFTSRNKVSSSRCSPSPDSQFGLFNRRLVNSF